MTLLLITASCASSSGVTEYDTTEQVRVESVYPDPDPEFKAMLDTYRDSLDQVMGERVATIHDTLRFGKPEGALGNLVADALRHRAASELRKFINIAVIGEISFRLFLTPGELTLGEVMEFMPYDNHLVILTLPGTKVAELANQVAEIGGAPVSGMRFRINGGKAGGILVNSQVLDPERDYLVATSSWVANGGDRFSVLWDYTDRIDLVDVDVRQLYIDYFKTRRDIYSEKDGRLRL